MNLFPHQRLGAYLVGLALPVDVVDVVAADEVGLVARVVGIETQALADLGAGLALAGWTGGLVVGVVVWVEDAKLHEDVEGRVAQGVEQDGGTGAGLVGEVAEASVLEGVGFVGEVWAGAIGLD